MRTCRPTTSILFHYHNHHDWLLTGLVLIFYVWYSGYIRSEYLRSQGKSEKEVYCFGCIIITIRKYHPSDAKTLFHNVSLDLTNVQYITQLEA